MSIALPAFDHNLVLPPHLGEPTLPDHLSPYPSDTVQLCKRFATSKERVEILRNFLRFRENLRGAGLVEGFQWLDGSFLEDVEARLNRAPRDIDVVTVFWQYSMPDLLSVMGKFPEVADPALAKANFMVDHYPFDASVSPENTIEWTRYWISLFSHNRLGVWKGMIRIELNTPEIDKEALLELERSIA